jgi:hypothetical protein
MKQLLLVLVLAMLATAIPGITVWWWYEAPMMQFITAVQLGLLASASLCIIAILILWRIIFSPED